MNEKKNQTVQGNEKKHRKLIRSPENLSPCDEPSYNSSSLTTTNIFADVPSNNNSPHINCKENISSYQKQVLLQSNNFATRVELPFTIPPSTFQPPHTTSSIAINRKPSITIRCSNDEGNKSELSSKYQSSVVHHSNISNSTNTICSLSTKISNKESVDQASNNFHINVTKKYPGNCMHDSLCYSPWKNEQPLNEQAKENSLFIFNDDPESSRIILGRDISQEHALLDQEHIFVNPVDTDSSNNILSQSNVRLNSFNGAKFEQTTFNSNNPFLNDTFEAIMAEKVEDKLCSNFLIREPDKVFLGDTMTPGKELMEDQLLKNKREKFSNASTMKICLVVSPPTNKIFKVSRCWKRVDEFFHFFLFKNLGIVELLLN